MPESSLLMPKRVCITPGSRAGQGTGHERGPGRRDGVHPVQEQDRRERRAERDGAFSRDVSELEDPETDEHAECQQRQYQAHRESADEERHVRGAPTASGATQHAPRVNSLSPTPAISRSSCSRCSTPSGPPPSKSVRTVSFSSIRPFLNGWNGNAAAWKCPSMSPAASSGRT